MPVAIARYQADFWALSVESTYTFSMGTHRVYNFNCSTAMASLDGNYLYYFKSGQSDEICRVNASNCLSKVVRISGEGPLPSSIFYYSWITAEQMLVLSRFCDSDDMLTVGLLDLRQRSWKLLRSFPVKQLRTACISVLNGALFLANSQEIVGFDLRSRELWTVYHFQSNAFSSTSLANGIEFCFALTPNEFGIFAGLKNQSLIMTAQDKLIFDKVWILNTLNTSISCRVCKPDPIHGYPTNRQCYAAQCLTDKLCLVSGFTRSSDSDPLTKHYDIWTFTYSNLQWHRCFTHSPVCSINAMINVSTMGSVFISGGLVINKSALASRFSSVIEVPVIVPTLQSLANRTIEKHKEAGSCKPRNLFIKLRKT